MFTPAGIRLRSSSTCARTPRATATVLVPGWRWMARMTEGLPLNHDALRLFCTSSRTWPRSPRCTGAPLRYVTARRRNAAASWSWPLACTV